MSYEINPKGAYMPGTTKLDRNNNPLKGIDANRISSINVYYGEQNEEVFVRIESKAYAVYNVYKQTTSYYSDESIIPLYPSDELTKKDVQDRVLFITPSLIDFLALRCAGASSILWHPNTPIPYTERKLVLLWKDPQGENTLEEIRNKGISCTLERIGEGEIYKMQPNECEEFLLKFKRQPGIASYIDEVFEQFRNEAKKEHIRTGFQKLDMALNGGLTPALYVLGAQPSYGKTTFALQIADYVASKGRPVKFISFEQSRGELIAKCASRRCNQKGEHIRASQFYSHDDYKECPQEIIEDMRGELSTLDIIECSAGDNFGSDPNKSKLDKLLEEIKISVEKGGEAPLIIIDHLQELQELGESAQYANIDNALDELRECTRKGSPVIALSQFNRRSYDKLATRASFAGSSGIERKADVLLAIDYEEILKAAGEGRKISVDDLGNEKPRKMCISIIKGRMLQPCTLLFEYDSEFDTFKERGEHKKASSNGISNNRY